MSIRRLAGRMFVQLIATVTVAIVIERIAIAFILVSDGDIVVIVVVAANVGR